MRKVLEYKSLELYFDDKTKDEVMEHLNDGWELQGGPFVAFKRVGQVMNGGLRAYMQEVLHKCPFQMVAKYDTQDTSIPKIIDYISIMTPDSLEPSYLKKRAVLLGNNWVLLDVPLLWKDKSNYYKGTIQSFVKYAESSKLVVPEPSVIELMEQRDKYNAEMEIKITRAIELEVSRRISAMAGQTEIAASKARAENAEALILEKMAALRQ